MSSSQPQINLPLMSLSLFQDLVQPIAHDIVLSAFSKERRSRQPCPSCGAIHNSRVPSSVVGKGNYISRPGQDIYGRAKQQASESASYFECINCSRKIAASRYAAHLERCLGGRGTRNKNTTSTASASYSVASPLSMSPSSPYVTEEESPPKPAHKKRKTGKAQSQHGYGISTMPNSPGNLSAAGSVDLGHDSDPGTNESSHFKRSSDKTVPGGGHVKSQVSKFLGRAGSPVLLLPSDSGSDRGTIMVKSGLGNEVEVEQSEDDSDA